MLKGPDPVAQMALSPLATPLPPPRIFPRSRIPSRTLCPRSPSTENILSAKTARWSSRPVWMPAMHCRPRDHRSASRHRSQYEQRQRNRPSRFERAMRKVAMEPDSQPKPGSEPQNGKQRPIQSGRAWRKYQDRRRGNKRQDVEQYKMSQLQSMKSRTRKNHRRRADRIQARLCCIDIGHGVTNVAMSAGNALRLYQSCSKIGRAP